MAIIAVVIAGWWYAQAPPPHFTVQPAFEMGPVPDHISRVIAQGDPLSQELLVSFENLRGHDEIVLQESLRRAFVTCMDGWIWILDLKNKAAKPFVDAPLMATGTLQVPGNQDKIVFCSSYLYGATYPTNEKVGIYELTISDKSIRPLVLRAPKLPVDFNLPKGNQDMVYTEQNSAGLWLDWVNEKNSRPP